MMRPLFTLPGQPQGLDVVEEAIERSGRNADPEWMDQAINAIKEVAKTHEEFTADDIWEFGLPTTRNNKALGAAFKAVARAGEISKTNTVRNSRLRKRNHGRTMAVWKSRKYHPTT